MHAALPVSRRDQCGLQRPRVASLKADVATLREIRVRVEQGYSYWERFGFENALTACGEAWQWQPLAEVFSTTLALGKDAEVRIPLNAQVAYARALDSGLFEHFEICSAFEVEGDDVVDATYYLFGTVGSIERSDALFLVGQWQQA